MLFSRKLKAHPCKQSNLRPKAPFAEACISTYYLICVSAASKLQSTIHQTFLNATIFRIEHTDDLDQMIAFLIALFLFSKPIIDRINKSLVRQEFSLILDEILVIKFRLSKVPIFTF